MNKYLFLVLSLFFVVQIKAQKVVIVDENSQKPVSNAMISVENQNLISNDSGFVFLKEIKGNSVIVTADGYLTKQVKLDVLRDQKNIIILSKNIFDLDEITVSANKWEQRVDEIPISIVPINVRDLDLINPQTTADLLSSNNHVFVQKSQLGGGSPMIRGYSANRVLIVVDGVRMNNAIYRSGNLQNIISIDPNSLQQAEIVLGPGSVIYGSDAIGGVMDFHSTKPVFASNDKKFFIKTNTLARYSSANNENTGHIDLNIGFKKVAFYSSYTYSKFGDLKMGSGNFEEYTRPEYIQTVNNIDIIVPNTDKEIQKFSGYNAQSFLQKISWQVSDNLTIDYGYYFSTTSDVPRYDRLIQYSDGLLKYAEWYYGPQTWQMHRLAIDYNHSSMFFDNIKIIAAYQDYTESRHDRKYRKDEIRERTENVKVINYNLDAYKEITKNTTLFYGFEGSHNTVGSYGQLRNIIDNSVEDYASRYPNGSTYENYDIYAQVKTKLSERFIYNLGARFSQIFINAIFDNTFYDFPFTETKSNPNAFTGSTGLIYSTANKYKFSLNLSSGFRAPNIDDIGKVFDSEPGNVVVPNPNLEPEKVYDVEIGFHKTSRKFFINITAFYSYLDNAMIRKDFTFNGQDSILYDGTMSKVQALVNDDYASIYGLQADLGFQISNYFVFKTAYNYIKGKDSEGNAVRHVPPAYGASHLIFNNQKFKFDFYTNYNAQILNENLAPTEQNKPEIYAIDLNGNPYLPSWWTMNFKVQYKISKKIKLNEGVENILNVRYRPYSSGIVAPGRNFIFSLKVSI